MIFGYIGLVVFLGVYLFSYRGGVEDYGYGDVIVSYVVVLCY